MATMTEDSVQELENSIDRLGSSTRKMDSVLAALFEVFSDRGLKPTPHLQQAQESLKKHLTEVQSASDRVTTRLQQMRELIRTSALITSKLELEDVLEEVMDTVIQLTGAERAYLMLYDQQQELQIRAARNWDQKSLSKDEVGLSRTVIEDALATKEAVITDNAQADKRFENKASIVVQNLRSIICIPLLLGGNVVGVLYADNRFRKEVFQQENVPILTAFGTQAAIAITNAKLFGQVKENLEEAERVIRELRIEVDQGRVSSQVDEITGTDYFKVLAETASELRARSMHRRDEVTAAEEKAAKTGEAKPASEKVPPKEEKESDTKKV